MSSKASKRDQLQPQFDDVRMAEKQSSDADSLLKKIARDISGNEAIDDLGKELGFTVGEIQNFIRTNNPGHEVTSYGTLCMLRKWSEGVSPSSLRSDLRGALMRANLVRTAETHLQSGSAPISPPLTKEQVQQCKKHLKEYYNASRRKVTVADPLNFMRSVDLDEIYTNLSLIDKSNMKKTQITYEDLLTNVESTTLSKRILIEGEAGVGKTTLCSKVAWDWCQGRILHDLDMVIVIPLRDVTGGKSIGDIVIDYLCDSNTTTPDHIDDYVLRNPGNVLLVFDGFDEFEGNIEERSNSEVIRILALERYKSCNVIVTTRPWKSHKFKMTKELERAYTFISAEGFDEDNFKTYIKRYFQNRQKDILAESLIGFLEENDIIRTNMAPFPIYCAMLCLMWKDFSEERRKELTKLQTFSEIFGEMISFLKEHYASKVCGDVENPEVYDYLTEADKAIETIGEITLNSLFDRTLSFPVEHFKECYDTMEICCRIGVLTIEKNVTRRKRRRDVNRPSLVESVVSFPHKLFQEYVAGVYIENVYFNDRAKYEELKQILLLRHEDFRYLLYFASALENELGHDIIKDLQDCVDDDVYFCIDVAFECHTEEAAKTVGQGRGEYHLSSNMPQHTKSGIAFMVRCDQARLLSLDNVKCGRTVSRHLAEGMCSSRVLRKVKITHSKLHADFYKIIGDKTSTCQLQDVSISTGSWDDGSQHHSSIGGNLAKWAFTMSSLSSFSLKCPYLDGDFLSTAIASASSCQIQNLELSFGSLDDSPQDLSSIWGNLTQWVFTMPSLSSFSMRCPYLDGDFFSKAVATASSCELTVESYGEDSFRWKITPEGFWNFRVNCFYLDGNVFKKAAASASSCKIQDMNFSLTSWYDDSEQLSSSGGDVTQWVFTLPSLLRFSLTCPYLDGDFVSTAISPASSCQIRHLELITYDYYADHRYAPSSGKYLAQVVCTLPRLSTFSVQCYFLLNNAFFSTAATLAKSCQIRELSMKFKEYPRRTSMSPSAGADLAEFLCHMPHLKRADINGTDLPETLFTGMASQPANCKLEDITINGKTLNQWLDDKKRRQDTELRCRGSSSPEGEVYFGKQQL